MKTVKTITKKGDSDHHIKELHDDKGLGPLNNLELKNYLESKEIDVIETV